MRQVILFISIIILTSCGGSKQMIKDSEFPLWLREKPNSSDYFEGVGSAKKLGTPDTYMKAARENALADMAQSISVKVSSVSTSTVFEGNNELYENYQQNIKSKSNEIFEGVELIDQFDDGINYHTYYRISKAEFYRLKAERKDKALNKGLGYFKQAKEQYNENNITRALSLYVKVVDALVDYLNEETRIDCDGQEIDLVYTARSEFDKISSSILIKAVNSSIDVKRGEFIDNDKLSFIVTYGNTLLSDIPVSFKYSGGYLKQKYVSSNINGEVSTSIQKLNSNNSSEEVSANIEIADLIRKASNDLFVRKMFDTNILKGVQVRINIIAPSVKFIDDENYSQYSQMLKKSLSNCGLEVNGGDDYNVILLITKEEKKQSYGILVSYNISVEVKSIVDNMKQKNFIYKFTGDGADVNTANNKALSKLNIAIDRRIAKEVSRFIMS